MKPLVVKAGLVLLLVLLLGTALYYTVLNHSITQFANQVSLWKKETRINLLPGKPYLLIFFSPYCDTCTRELKELKSVYDRKIPVVGISFYRPKGALLAFTCLVTGETAERLSHLYNGTLGMMFFLDQQGSVIRKKNRDETMKDFYFRSLEVVHE